MKIKITNKGLYWGLIATFTLLYLLVAFVSTLHAIDFFELSNNLSLAVLLGVAYEVGQASVLFSILMTKNKEKFLPWILMILLTALQVTANVYASFKHMTVSGNNDWTYWYTSILKIFGVTGGSTETYQVIISWISGALLPIVALGMTALVAQNIKLIAEENDEVKPIEEELDEILDEDVPVSHKKKENKGGYFDKIIPTPEEKRRRDEEIKKIKDLMSKPPIKSGIISDSLKKTLSPGLPLEDDLEDSSVTEPPIKVTVDPPKDVEEYKEYIPALSDEEISQMFHDELEGKLMDDEEEEDATERPTLDLTTPKGENIPLIDSPTPSGSPKVELETPEVIEDPKSDPPPTPSQEKVESEEDRLERLRNIARENLKKK